MRKYLFLIALGFASTVLSAQRSSTTGNATPKTQTGSAAPTTSTKSTSTFDRQSSGKSTERTDNGSKSSKTRSTRSTSAYPAPSTTTAAAPTTANPQTTQRNAGTNPTPSSSTKRQDTKAASATTATSAPTLAPATVTAEAAKPIRVNWMTIEEAIEKNKTEKRKIFIDVYTEWCGWCKRMDETTFTDPKVVKYLNDNYYAVKFDAEQKQDIVFNGKTYQFKKVGTRGYHELAAEWLNNRMSYPTSVYLDENLTVIQPLPGFLEAARFETIITYFASDSYKRTPWETYEKTFVSGRNR